MNDAWNEADTVMPGAWRVVKVENLRIGGPPNDHVAVAVSIGALKAGTLNGYGDTPDGALNDLARRLREKRDGAGDAPEDETP